MLTDSILTDKGFRQTPMLPQMFVLMRHEKIVAFIAKIVGDLLLSVAHDGTDTIIEAPSAQVELRTIVHGPGRLRYFGLKLDQNN